MTLSDAREFFVQQVVKQAEREHLKLTQTEVAMLRFSEVEPPEGMTPEALYELNDRFEAECDSAEYETKISTLLEHARLKATEEGSHAAEEWREARSALKGHDLYLLVMLDAASSSGSIRVSRPRWDSVKLFFTALAVAIGVVGFAFAYGNWGSPIAEKIKIP